MWRADSEAQLGTHASPCPLPTPRQMPTLPVVDLSPFLLASTPAARAACASAVHNACLSFGFLYINGLDSVLSQEELGGSIAVARAFFNTPSAEKQKLRIRPGDGARGYQVGWRLSGCGVAGAYRYSGFAAAGGERYAVQGGSS